MKNVICSRIIDVSKDGITLESAGEKIYIDFEECAKNFSLEKGKVSKCVANRDITALSFTFYTCPQTRIIFKKYFLKDLIAGKSALCKFTDVQKAIRLPTHTLYTWHMTFGIIVAMQTVTVG